MLLPLAGLVLGVLLGLLLQVDVSFEFARYTAVAIVAALDSVLGAVRAELDGVYDNRIFVTGFATNALVAGTLALVLSAFSLTYDRARLSVALIGVWVALSAFIFQSTLLEEVVTVSWGVSMFTLMVGPFSDSFQVSRTATLAPAVAPAVSSARAAGAVELPRAA